MGLDEASLFIHFRRVIVTEYEPPRNHVVLKATIYSLGESGSAEGASLYVKHEREENEEYERALFVMPHRSGIMKK